MFKGIDRSTGTGFMFPVVLSWQKDKPLAGPYRQICTFRAPPSEYDILEGNRRGIAYSNPEGQLYFVDAVEIASDDPSKPSTYQIRELGIQKLRALPKKGKANRVNPNEWVELKANLMGDAPEDVKSDLRKGLGHPKEWPFESFAQTHAALRNTLGLH